MSKLQRYAMFYCIAVSKLQCYANVKTAMLSNVLKFWVGWNAQTPSCNSHACATAKWKQGERQGPRKWHLKVTSMHMEVWSLFGRNDWRNGITNNCLN